METLARTLTECPACQAATFSALSTRREFLVLNAQSTPSGPYCVVGLSDHGTDIVARCRVFARDELRFALHSCRA